MNDETPIFDHVRFAEALDAVRDSREIENTNQLAIAIGVNPTSLTRLCSGAGIEFGSLVRIIRWTKLDLRKFLKVPAPDAAAGRASE